MIIDLKTELGPLKSHFKTVVHVGAHHGQEEATYREMGIEPIYIEANPDVYQVLKTELPNRECHNVAITDHVGQIDFHITSFDQSSSILPLKLHAEIYPEITHQKTVSVPCTTLDTLFAGRSHCADLMNLDIQGAELLALRGAAQTLKRTKAILTEVNRVELYTGCGLIGDLDRFLYQQGFLRTQTSYKFHETWGDALYLKTDLIDQNRPLLALKNWFQTRRLRSA